MKEVHYEPHGDDDNDDDDNDDDDDDDILSETNLKWYDTFRDFHDTRRNNGR